MQWSYVVGSDLPDLTINWLDDDGSAINFASGYTFEVKVAPIGTYVATFTKTTGITGASTEPNLTVQWATSNELNSLSAGSYDVQIRATRTSDSKERFVRGRLAMIDRIT